MLWNHVCLSERDWLKCESSAGKNRLKAVFCSKRKHFDRAVQKCKRQYWYKLQEDLLDSVETDQNKFWKSIGSNGIASKKRHSIPLEIVKVDGSLETDTDSVLDHWKTSYSNLLNGSSPVEDQSNDSVPWGNRGCQNSITIFLYSK